MAAAGAAAAHANPGFGPKAGAVCRLTWNGEFGSGFHYGGGWIVTNSHVVGRHAEDLPLISVEFTKVIVNPNTDPPQHLVFPPCPRVCFFKRIRYLANGAPDNERIDLAFFWVGGEPQYSALSSSTVVMGRNVPDVGSPAFNTYCLHHRDGGALQRSPPSPPTFESATVVDGVAENTVFIRRNNVTTGPGSSGSPVFHANTNEVVALHFSGQNMDEDPHGYDTPHSSKAISFDLVRDILGKLVPAIAQLPRAHELLRLASAQPDSEHAPLMRQRGQSDMDDVRRIATNLGLEVVIPGSEVVVPSHYCCCGRGPVFKWLSSFLCCL